MKKIFFLSVVIPFTLLLIRSCSGQGRIYRTLRSPCSSAANYDGTDIAVPVEIDNSTGTPVYKFIDGYLPSWDPKSRRRRAVTSDRFDLWPFGKVYYSINSGFTDAEEERLYDAMRHWEEHTCIRFLPRLPNSAGIIFNKGRGCCSYVGRIAGALQPVSIGSLCSRASVIHEIGHVVGFWHEQSRPDRDKFVNIHTENIIPGFDRNFRKHDPSTINSLGVTYDFNSIMHYSQYAFTKGGKVTISSKEPGIPIGRALDLSPLDILQANLLYQYQCRFRGSSESKLPPKVVATPPPVVLDSNGVYVNGTSGSFSGPRSYKKNTNYTWVIEAPLGLRIRLTLSNIVQLDFQPRTVACPTSYIQAYNGRYESNYQYERVCGRNPQYYFRTTRNFIRIRLYSTRAGSVVPFTAAFQAEDINECSYVRCEHSCTNTHGSYNCICRTGYYLKGDGRSCFDENECATNNGGCSHTCVNMAGTYRCECPSGYSLAPDKRTCFRGLNCLVNNAGCSHMCRNTATGPVCSCPNGYQLLGNRKTCVDINECQSNPNPCDTTTQTCVNQLGSYRCDCISGFVLSSGSCEDVDECRSNPCSQTCVNTRGSYYCQCLSGYNLSGTTECTDIDECQTSNGGCDEQCVNHNGGHQCSCGGGLQLMPDRKSCGVRSGNCTVGGHGCPVLCTRQNQQCCLPGHTINRNKNLCRDVNECVADTDNCQFRCENTIGSYQCRCQVGTTLRRNKHNCRDINECSTGKHKCSQVCVNSYRSYDCGCNPGYELHSDGYSCSDIDECKETSTNVCSQQCVNTEGSFKCVCRSGYALAADNITCTDIDECEEGTFNCKQLCINTVGGYRCGCRPGFRLHGKKQWRCLDINECNSGNHSCDHICTNKVGSFSCSCRDGYVLHQDGHTCVDVNECMASNGGCDELCSNSVGSYNCSCPDGLAASKNGRSCKPIASLPCSQGTHYCPPLCTKSNCSCEDGYELSPSSQYCRDINECSLNNGMCDQECVNVIGGHQCQCSNSHILLDDGKSCEVKDCKRNNGGCEQNCFVDARTVIRCSCFEGYVIGSNPEKCLSLEEARGPTTRLCSVPCRHICNRLTECSCRPGFRLLSDNVTCKDVNECRASNGGCEQLCANSKGSFECSCRHGYELAEDNSHCLDVNECLNNNGGCDHMCNNTDGCVMCTCRAGYVLGSDTKSCLVHRCGGLLQMPSGYINSTGYPTVPYPSLSNCTWTIDLPQTYKSIELKFINFSIECKDNVSVINGDSGLSLGSYCGSQTPGVVHTSTGKAMVKFTSDATINWQGFSIQYTGLLDTVQGNFACGGVFGTTVPFSIGSPDFPLYNTGQRDCLWIIGVPAGKAVKITFLYLDIENEPCATDYVAVFTSWHHSPESEVARICKGAATTTEFVSKGDQGRVGVAQYRTKLNAYRGFHAKVTFV